MNKAGNNQVSESNSFLRIKDVKNMPEGKISGCVVAKIHRKPYEVKNVLNMIIEDEEQERIQICCFGELAKKYFHTLHHGACYRF